MQNKNSKSYNLELRLQKVKRAVPPIMKSRIIFTQQSKYSEKTKISSCQNLVVPFVEGHGSKQNKEQSEEEKLQAWQTLLFQTFEKCLLQLDEVFLNLRSEETLKNPSLTVMNSYKAICENLRMEILIAIEKLDLTNNKSNRKERDKDFLNKMSNLKSQLSHIRWQYHQAIKEFNDVSN